MKKILFLSIIVIIAVLGFAGQATASECVYVSSVTTWSPCTNGMQYATEVQYSTVEGSCSDVPVVQSCTMACYNPATSQPLSFHNTLGLSYSGLTHYWKADASSFVDSKGTKNGTLKNGASITTGKFGSALSLDGIDDYVELNGEFSDATTLSVGGWFYSQNDDLGVIISDLTDHAVNDFEFAISPNSIYVRADKSGALLRGENEDVSEAVSVGGLNNSWNHIVWQMEPTVSKLYVNGQLVSTINKTGKQVGYHSPTPDIGRTYDEGPLPWNYGYFKGKIDDLFYITGKVLTECEIKQLALGPNACNELCCTPISHNTINQTRSAHIISCQNNGTDGVLFNVNTSNVGALKDYMRSKGITTAVVANRAVDGDYVIDKKCAGEATWPESAKTIQAVISGDSICFNDIPDTTTSMYAICSNVCGLSGSCVPTPTTASIGSDVVWSVNPAGGTSPYSFVWSGDMLTGSGQSKTVSYTTSGVKNASVAITDSANPASSITANCSPLTINEPISTPAGFSVSGVTVNTETGIDPDLETKSCKSVNISWDKVGDATGYILYKGRTADLLQEHATRGEDQNFYNDTAFFGDGGTYYYAVRAKRGAGELSATSTIKSISLPACVQGTCGTNGTQPAVVYYDTSWPTGGTFCSIGTASENNIAFPTKTSSLQSWLCVGNTGTNPTCEAQLSDAISGVCAIEQINKPAQENSYYINKQFTLNKGATEIPDDAKGPLVYKWYERQGISSVQIGNSESMSKLITTVGKRDYSLRVIDKDGDVVAFCNAVANFVSGSGNVQEQ